MTGNLGRILGDFDPDVNVKINISFDSVTGLWIMALLAKIEQGVNGEDGPASMEALLRITKTTSDIQIKAGRLQKLKQDLNLSDAFMGHIFEKSKVVKWFQYHFVLVEYDVAALRLFVQEIARKMKQLDCMQHEFTFLANACGIPIKAKPAKDCKLELLEYFRQNSGVMTEEWRKKEDGLLGYVVSLRSLNHQKGIDSLRRKDEKQRLDAKINKFQTETDLDQFVNKFNRPALQSVAAILVFQVVWYFITFKWDFKTYSPTEAASVTFAPMILIGVIFILLTLGQVILLKNRAGLFGYVCCILLAVLVLNWNSWFVSMYITTPWDRFVCWTWFGNKEYCKRYEEQPSWWKSKIPSADVAMGPINFLTSKEVKITVGSIALGGFFLSTFAN